MNISISSKDISNLSSDLSSKFQSVTASVQDAMADMFYAITRSNIGDFGLDRPGVWADLTPQYAKKVGRDHATLRVSGTLESAIRNDGTVGDSADVSISNDDVPYATVHQYGGGNNIPARPYFPLDQNGEPTPFTVKQVTEAAQAELENQLG